MNNPISRPGGWLKNAIPTTKGWRHAKRREILKGASFTQEQVDEYMARMDMVDPLAEKIIAPKIVSEAAVATEHTHDDGTTHSHEGGDKPHHHHDDGTTHDHEGGDEPHDHDNDSKGMHEMTKLELEALGRQHGIELDRRHNKAALIEELTDHMEMKDYDDCSKMELEAIGRRYGLELDRRKKKETLIEELQEVLDDEIQIT